MAMKYSLGGPGQGSAKPNKYHKNIKVTRTEKEELDNAGPGGSQKRTDTLRSIVGIKGRKSYPAGSMANVKENESINKKIDRTNAQTTASPNANRISEESREKRMSADKEAMEEKSETDAKYKKLNSFAEKSQKTASLLKAASMKNVDGSKGTPALSPIKNKSISLFKAK